MEEEGDQQATATSLPPELLCATALWLPEVADWVALAGCNRAACRAIASPHFAFQWLVRRSEFPLLTGMHALRRFATEASVAAAARLVARHLRRTAPGPLERYARHALDYWLPSGKRQASTPPDAVLAEVFDCGIDVACSALAVDVRARRLPPEAAVAFDAVGALLVACCSDRPAPALARALLEELPRSLVVTAASPKCERLLLHRAAGMGFRTVESSLRDGGFRTNDYDDRLCCCTGDSPEVELRAGAEEGAARAEVVRAILGVLKDDAKSGSSQALSPLHSAIGRGAWSALSELVAHGHDFRSVPPTNAPLLPAHATVCSYQYRASAGQTLSSDADMDMAIAALVAAGARLDERNVWSRTALHRAATAGRDAVVEALLRHGASADVADEDGALPLHKCCTPRAVEALVAAYPEGAQRANQYGQLPLHSVIDEMRWFTKKDLETVEALLRAHPSAAGHADNDGQHALHIAADNGVGARVIQRLLEACPASLRAQRQRDGLTPLHAAFIQTSISFDCGNALLLLRASSAEDLRRAVGMRDTDGQTLLHWAARACSAAAIEDMGARAPAELRAAAACKDVFGRSPLHLAAAHGNADCVRLLLQLAPRECDYTPNGQDMTPLCCAVMSQSAATVEAMMRLVPVDRLWDMMGAEVPHGTPLHLAVGRPDDAVLRALVAGNPLICGATMKFKDCDGNTPLHLAAKCPASTRLLTRSLPMQSWLAMHVQNDDGNTPLHVAAIQRCPEALVCMMAVVPPSSVAPGALHRLAAMRNNEGHTVVSAGIRRMGAAVALFIDATVCHR